MKKYFRYYVITWAILLATYQIVAFSVQALPGYVVRYDARFWVCWAFILAAFVGQLACAYAVFQSKSADKMFLNVPVVRQSYAGAVAMTVIGSVCMLIPDCPGWIAAVLCVLVLGYSAAGVVKAKAAAQMVADMDVRVRTQTSFIRSLTADAEVLLAQAPSDAMRAPLKRVYEAARYSDPMSHDSVCELENRISLAFDALRAAVSDGAQAQVEDAAGKLVALLETRNAKCRLLK